MWDAFCFVRDASLKLFSFIRKLALDQFALMIRKIKYANKTTRRKLTINLTSTDFTVARARARILLRPWEHAHLAGINFITNKLKSWRRFQRIKWISVIYEEPSDWVAGCEQHWQEMLDNRGWKKKGRCAYWITRLDTIDGRKQDGIKKTRKAIEKLLFFFFYRGKCEQRYSRSEIKIAL